MKRINKILKEGRKFRQSNTLPQASANVASANVNDRADSICWFCHADITNPENSKCAGCRKVIQNTPVLFLDFKLLVFRRATATRGAKKPTGVDMVIIALRCRRRSGRRLRQRRLNKKWDEFVTHKASAISSAGCLLSEIHVIKDLPLISPNRSSSHYDTLLSMHCRMQIQQTIF